MAVSERGCFTVTYSSTVWTAREGVLNIVFMAITGERQWFALSSL